MSNALSKPTYTYKRFRVKRADGGSTTVSVDPALIVQVCAALGSYATVSRVVREAAAKFVGAESNGAKNRSAYVTRTLKALVEGKGMPDAASAAVAASGTSTDSAAPPSTEGSVGEEVPSAEAPAETTEDVVVADAA